MNSYLEDLIWMSYRYCIGRKTITATMHAEHIAKNSYNNIPDNRKEFMAHDIRNEINIKLWLNNVFISDNRHHITEDALSAILLKLNETYNGEIPNDWDETLYRFQVTNGKVSIKQNTNKSNKPNFENLYSKYIDFISWIKLANALDKQSHKKITIDDGGKEKELTCFSYPMLDAKMSNIYTVWVSLDDYLQNPHKTQYILPEKIKNIK